MKQPNLSPDVDLKEQLRAEYLKSDRRRDHGTRSTGKDKEYDYLTPEQSPGYGEFDFAGLDEELTEDLAAEMAARLEDPDHHPYYRTGYDEDPQIAGYEWDEDHELGYATDFRGDFLGSIAMARALDRDVEYAYTGLTGEDYGGLNARGFHVTDHV